MVFCLFVVVGFVVVFVLFCFLSFRVREDIFQVFFLSTVSSFLTYDFACWGRYASKQDRDRLVNTIRKAGEVTGRQ